MLLPLLHLVQNLVADSSFFSTFFSPEVVVEQAVESSRHRRKFKANSMKLYENEMIE